MFRMNESSISRKKPKWYLESVSDTGTKWVLPIEPLPFTIGRDKDCNLTLQSKWVSRHQGVVGRVESRPLSLPSLIKPYVRFSRIRLSDVLHR